MSSDGWVASDATKYSLEDKRPDWVSLVSVAVAVDDLSSFNEEYYEIVRSYMSDFGIKRRFPVIKSDDISRWAEDWLIKEVKRDLVEELLQIEHLDTIQITETSLHSRWVTIFAEDGNREDTVRSEEFIDKYLQPYYNLISIWEYLRKSNNRPRTHTQM